MDNHRFSNAIHVFIAQHPDNDVDNEDMPELVLLDAPGSHVTEPQQQMSADVEMTGEASDIDSSEDHENVHDSESDRDAHEVEMQTVNDHRLNDHSVPDSAPISHRPQDQPTVSNRRARVEDDEDEDRDRRHPSQRIGSSANAASSAGPSSSTPVLPSSQIPSAPQPTPGVRLQGQAPIFSRTVVDEATTRAHPFRFFQHMMSNNNNNNNNDAGNTNPVPSGGPIPAPQPHQDGNTGNNQPHGRPAIIEGFSVTLDIGLSPAFHMGRGGQPPDAEPTPNAADPNLNANPNPQIPSMNLADFMARIGLFGQAMGLGENGPEGTTGATAPPGGNNPDQGTGGAAPTPGTQFGFNLPAGGFNLANLAGLGFGFNLDGSGFGEKEDPERARKLVDGLEEVPVGLVKRLERVGGTGGGMGEDETKGGDGGCAICWDRLLGGSTGEEDHQHEESEKKEEASERTQPEVSTNGDEASKSSTAKIVSLPCAHVFHAECLIPWFSRPRQTTCPSCRFNIDPENLTYVSWRRRMRERRERERAEAETRGDPENANGNESGQDGIATPLAPAVAAPLPDAPSVISEHVLSFLSALEGPPLVHVRSETPNATAVNAHPTPAPRSQSQPPSSSSSAPTPSTSQLSPQTHSPPGGNAADTDIHPRAQEDWDVMPGLQDVSDSDEEDEIEDDEDGDQDEDQDEDEDEDGAQEQGNGIQAPPNDPPIAPTSGPQIQTQAPRPGRNDPLAPRTIQTAHGLVTLIPVPFNFPFPSVANGVGVGVQAGGNGDYTHSSLALFEVDLVSIAANASAPVTTGQGQLPNVNVNPNTQGEYMHLITRLDIHIPQLFPFRHHSLSPAMNLSRELFFLTPFLPALPQGLRGLPFNVPLPRMPEFEAQASQGAAPAPPAAPTSANNANANTNQTLPANPFADALEADMTNTREQLIQHLLSQGLGFTAEEAENIRRSNVAGRQANRLRRGEDPIVQVAPEDEDEDDMTMDIDEGMGMVVDLTMEQGGMPGIGGTGADAGALETQDEQEFAQVINFLSHAARHARGQAQAGTQTQGQAQQQDRGTEGGAPSTQSDVPPIGQQQSNQQPQPQQQQGQGFAPFMAGLNTGFNIANHNGNLRPEDGRVMNEFVAQMFANLTRSPSQQARQQVQGQDAQPRPQAQPQPQPQADQEPAEEPNPTNNNNGGRPRQAQFAFGNVTIGPFTNIGSLFDQIPIFNPNGATNANGNDSGQERVRKVWRLPPAPGPTLRQRIERRERDAGLRCYDISCGVGPSDEDPDPVANAAIADMRQLMIMNKNHGQDGKTEGVCMHTFHPGCLVSAERVALAGADVNVVEGGDVEVSCPVCRSTGCVRKQEWDDGVMALAPDVLSA